MNQLNNTLENLSLNEANPYVLATTLKSTSSRPSDFTGLPRDVVIERLRNKEFIRLHGNFIKRVFQGETNEASFNIRVVLCSFFADAGMRDTFPDESCVQVATAFTSLYEPIIEQYASGSEPNEDSKSALFSVLRNLVDVFRAHGIETAEKSRKRLIEIIRMIIDAKKVIQQEENNLQAMESSIDAANSELDRIVAFMCNSRSIVPPNGGSIDERVVFLFNDMGENSPF